MNCRRGAERERADGQAGRMEKPFQFVQNGNKINNNWPIAVSDDMEQIKCEPGEEDR